MRRPGPNLLSRAVKRFAGDEDGAMMVWCLCWTLIFLAFGGLAIDMTNAWRMRTFLQGTADAAALAAALRIDSEATARTNALTISQRNMPTAKNGDVVQNTDIAFGVWDPVTRNFTASTVNRNAVKVTAKRASSRNNKVPTLLLGFAGFGAWDIAATSVAIAMPIKTCPSGAFVAQGVMTAGTNYVLDQTCLHGEGSLTVGSGGSYTDTVTLSAAATTPSVGAVSGTSPKTAAEVSYQSTRKNGFTPAIESYYTELLSHYLAGSAPTTYAGTLPLSQILSGTSGAGTGSPVTVVSIDTSTDSAPGDPYQIVSGTWIIRDGGDLQQDTLYLVDGDISFQAGAAVTETGVAILATGSIGEGGATDLRFYNSILFAHDDLTISSALRTGYTTSGSYCAQGSFNTYLFSLQSIFLDGLSSSGEMYGTVVAALDSVSIAGGISDGGAVHVEARSDIAVGNDLALSNCGLSLVSDFGLTLPTAVQLPPTSIVY